MTAQSNITPESIVNDLRYLQLLSRSFPTIADASTEIINLEAILNLPKGTEHFLTDVHGEYEPFVHILNNGAGKVKAKINAAFGDTISKKDQFGKYVSLIPIYEARGVTLTGFKYPLKDHTLVFEQSLAISNELEAEEGIISFSEGKLLLIESRD